MQRVLVIDDDPTVTSVLRRGLAYEGYARHRLLEQRSIASEREPDHSFDELLNPEQQRDHRKGDLRLVFHVGQRCDTNRGQRRAGDEAGGCGEAHGEQEFRVASDSACWGDRRKTFARVLNGC